MSFAIAQTLYLVFHDLINLVVEFLVLTAVVRCDDKPNDQPQISSEGAQDQMKNVVGSFLLTIQYEDFLVHCLACIGLGSEFR